MATHVKILSKKERTIFENPPEFIGIDKKKYFYPGKWENSKIKKY